MAEIQVSRWQELRQMLARSWSEALKSELVRALAVLLLLTVVLALALVAAFAIDEHLLDKKSQKNIGYVWATLAVAVGVAVKCMGDLFALTEIADDWIQKRSDIFLKPRTIGNFWVLCMTVALGCLSWSEIVVRGEESQAAEEKAAAQLIVLRTSPATTYVAAPAILFPRGRLASNRMDEVSGERPVPSGLFEPAVLAFDTKSRGRIRDVVEAISKYCYTSGGVKSFTVLGFASAAPFLDAAGGERKDSRQINWHLANDRALAMAEALGQIADEGGYDLSFDAHKWGSPDAMEEARSRTFSAVQLTFATDFDHRSALIVNANGLDCGYLPRSEQGYVQK